MAEALGAVAAGVQLFEIAIVIFKRINKANKRQKEHTEVLKKYGLELGKIRDLAESVKNEKALEGADVSGPLNRLKELENRLYAWLAKVDPCDKGSLRRFADQLVRGKEDRKKLDDIMKNLDRAKQDLSLVIDMHQIRLSYNISQAVITNSSATTETSQQPKKISKAGTGGNVTAPTQAQTNAQLSDSGFSSMGSEDDDTSIEGSSEASSEDSSESSDSDAPGFTMPMIRRVKRNKVKRGALMVNAPLGKKDLYKHIQVIEIEDNECEEDSEMYNYPNDESGMKLARKERKKRIAEKREQMLWEKEHGSRRS